MHIQINIPEESYKMFHAALMLTGEDEDSVMNNLIINYAHKAFKCVVDKRTPEGPTSDNQSNLRGVTENEQKKMFVTWFRSLTRNGKAYNPVTISAYAGRIENACSDPTFATVPINNLFAIADLSQFINIQMQIKSCDGYAAFDAKSHNGFTAALKKYEDFLRFQASGNSIQAAPAPTYTPHRSSAVHRWTMEEDEICCKRFLECYVIKRNRLDIVQFLQTLSKEVPDISEGSLRMKIQNIKYLAVQSGFKDTANITWLSQYSLQCEKAFKKALADLGL